MGALLAYLSRKIISSLILLKFNLVDIWRRFHPRSREVSWFNADHSIGTRLDKFFVSRDFTDSVFACDIVLL